MYRLLLVGNFLHRQSFEASKRLRATGKLSNIHKTRPIRNIHSYTLNMETQKDRVHFILLRLPHLGYSCTK